MLPGRSRDVDGVPAVVVIQHDLPVATLGVPDEHVVVPWVPGRRRRPIMGWCLVCLGKAGSRTTGCGSLTWRGAAGRWSCCYHVPEVMRPTRPAAALFSLPLLGFRVSRVLLTKMRQTHQARVILAAVDVSAGTAASSDPMETEELATHAARTSGRPPPARSHVTAAARRQGPRSALPLAGFRPLPVAGGAHGRWPR
jgi:hypothetical protein